jgi:hemerythrin
MKKEELAMPYQVTRSLETGNALIDQEHQELLATINRLLDACRRGERDAELNETLQCMKSYTEKLFDDEETMQRQCSYPEYHAHHLCHEAYKKTVTELCERLRESEATEELVCEVNTSLAGCFIAHIRREDKKFAAYLREHS